MAISDKLNRLLETKNAIKTAINNKGGSIINEPFKDYADAIDNIETDPSIGTTNAIASDILIPKKAVSQGQLLTGTMPNNGAISKIITTQNGQINIPAGYTSGGAVAAQFANLVPEYIADGIDIGGVVGELKQGKGFSSGNVPESNSYVTVRGLSFRPSTIIIEQNTFRRVVSVTLSSTLNNIRYTSSGAYNVGDYTIYDDGFSIKGDLGGTWKYIAYE